MKTEKEYQDLSDEELAESIRKKIEDANLALMAGYNRNLSINFSVKSSGIKDDFLIVELSSINKILFRK